jgi:hypothetical protein
MLLHGTVHLDKLTVAELLKNFPTIYGMNVHSAFIRAHHISLRIQSQPSACFLKDSF